MVSNQRQEELRATFREGAPWRAHIAFLDNLNEDWEIYEIEPVLRECKPLWEAEELITWYRDNLKRWPAPKLEDWFKRDFPLLSTKLDTPQKVRIFLRGADFVGVSAAAMGAALEEVIRRHEVQGERFVHYPNTWGKRYDAIKIVNHSQIQAWALTRLAFPDSPSVSSGSIGLLIDWRSEEERKQQV